MLVQLLNGSSTQTLTCRNIDLQLEPAILINFTNIRSSLHTYSENISVALRTSNDNRDHHFEVSLTNLGQGISRGNTFPSRGTSFQASSEIVIDDSYWFFGSVYGYDFDCRSCKDRITVHKKIQVESKEELPFTSGRFFLNN
jgi:hypothetical protein